MQQKGHRRRAASRGFAANGPCSIWAEINNQIDESAEVKQNWGNTVHNMWQSTRNMEIILAGSNSRRSAWGKLTKAK
jgi:hypothetical protein